MVTKLLETRKFRTTAVLACALGMALATAAAQQDAPPPPPPDGQMQGPPPGDHGGPGGPGGRGGNPERRMEMLQKRLNLSNDQTAQVKTIFTEERTKMESLRSNTSLSQDDRRSQMMAIHQDGETRVHALLTADQKVKFDEMQAKMRERMQEGHRGGPGGPPPPPPPPPAPQQ